ncbi:hypothetical protein AVEN_165793-1 [Araneus ventricosus]|uniref:Uncharacterized protein n=1 Tax=Araneus ventricosus TaxID=182803 RepID=A0A4Y2EDF2_ARAVE|nr:hypothetical protein AVEN_165793-1 [Araneus ventricosus]
MAELIPIILLGIRTAVKEDLQSSCSELVYGTTLRLPCDMIDVSDIPPCDNEFITDLRHRMQQLNPVATSAHCTDRSILHPSFTEIFISYLLKSRSCAAAITSTLYWSS